MLKLTDIAHSLIISKVQSAKVLIDATVGNGHDLLFLLNHCSPKAKVYGFDIQIAAIENTRNKLESKHLNGQCHLIHDCHSQLKTYVSQAIDLAIFNLGYLPGGNKSITTLSNTSLLAVQACLKLLAPGGLISLMLYPGHPEGKIETEVIENYLKSVSQQYQSFYTKKSSASSSPIHYLIF